MARLPRKNLPDGIYHVTARGVAQAAIFLDDDDRRAFLRLLAQAVEHHAWCCHVFCLMTTHYHLVAEATRAALSAGLHRLNGLYAQRVNRRHKRHGHVFADRFWASVIENEEQLSATCCYVVSNPVRAGLCTEPQAWPWSASRYGTQTA